MPVSTVQVSPLALTYVLNAFGLLGVNIIGSKQSDGVVSLIIEGECVPSADLVVAALHKSNTDEGASFRAEFISVGS